MQDAWACETTLRARLCGFKTEFLVSVLSFHHYGGLVFYGSTHARTGHPAPINQEARVAYIKDAWKNGSPQIIWSIWRRLLRGASASTDCATSQQTCCGFNRRSLRSCWRFVQLGRHSTQRTQAQSVCQRQGRVGKCNVPTGLSFEKTLVGGGTILLTVIHSLFHFTCIAFSLNSSLWYSNSTLICLVQFYLGISYVAVVLPTIVSCPPLVRCDETLRNCWRHVGFTANYAFVTTKPNSVALVLVAVLVMSVLHFSFMWCFISPCVSFYLFWEVCSFTHTCSMAKPSALRDFA